VIRVDDRRTYGHTSRADEATWLSASSLRAASAASRSKTSTYSSPPAAPAGDEAQRRGDLLEEIVAEPTPIAASISARCVVAEV